MHSILEIKKTSMTEVMKTLRSIKIVDPNSCEENETLLKNKRPSFDLVDVLKKNNENKTKSLHNKRLSIEREIERQQHIQDRLKQEKHLRRQRKKEQKQFELELIKARKELINTNLFLNRTTMAPDKIQEVHNITTINNNTVGDSELVNSKQIICNNKNTPDCENKNKLLRIAFQSWFYFVHQRSQQTFDVTETRDLLLLEICFKAWKSYMTKSKCQRLATKKKANMAAAHSRNIVLRRMFIPWLLTTRIEKADSIIRKHEADFLRKVECFNSMVTASSLPENSKKMNNLGNRVQSARETFSKGLQSSLPTRSARAKPLKGSDVQCRRIQLDLECSSRTERVVKKQIASNLEQSNSGTTAKYQCEEDFVKNKSKIKTISRIDLVTPAVPQKSSDLFCSDDEANRHKKSAFLKKMDALRKKQSGILQKCQERRERIQQEKSDRIRLEAAKRQHEIDEEKRQRQKEIREKKMFEKQKAKRMLAARLRQNKQNEIAEDGRRQILLKYYGLLPWMNLIKQRKNLIQLANDHFRKSLLRSTYFYWLTWFRGNIRLKLNNASIVYETILKKRVFTKIKSAYLVRLNLENKANEHRRRKILRTTFSNWIMWSKISIKRNAENELIADSFYQRCAKLKTFKALYRFVTISTTERSREKRIDGYRKQILEIIPDFIPPSPSPTSFLVD